MYVYDKAGNIKEVSKPFDVWEIEHKGRIEQFYVPVNSHTTTQTGAIPSSVGHSLVGKGKK